MEEKQKNAIEVLEKINLLNTNPVKINIVKINSINPRNRVI